MKSFAKAALIAASVFALVALLQVSSCRADDVLTQSPAGIGIDLPKIELPSWGWIALAAAGLFFFRGGNLSGILDMVRSWFGGGGGAPPDIRKILDAAAVLLKALPIKDQFGALWAQIQAAGMPASFSIRARWPDGTEKNVNYGDAALATDDTEKQIAELKAKLAIAQFGNTQILS